MTGIIGRPQACIEHAGAEDVVRDERSEGSWRNEGERLGEPSGQLTAAQCEEPAPCGR